MNFAIGKMKRYIDYRNIFIKALCTLFFLWIIPFLFDKYVDTLFPFIHENDITKELIGFHGPIKDGKKWCPPQSPYLLGMDRNVYQTLELREKAYAALKDSLDIKSGGVWEPSDCQARYESVIIVPYRNRSTHLKKFVSYMHPFLQKQQLHYRILIIEQNDNLPFNRGKLINIGFKEAKLLGPPNYCFIFHDVDLIPENDFNIYACTHHPRHMYSSLDVFRYHLPYRSLFGGAVSILAPHFEEVNGFSNTFKGWGGEDDDFSMRLKKKGLVFERFDPKIARYTMLSHIKETPSPGRYEELSRGSSNNASFFDGLSSLKYEVSQVKYFPLYTHIYVK